MANRRGATAKAIVAPHIDFHRGGPAYAWAYKPLAESAGADLYIILGTSHCGGQTPYILTLKNFETPLGLVETDRDFVSTCRRNAPRTVSPTSICIAANIPSNFKCCF